LLDGYHDDDDNNHDDNNHDDFVSTPVEKVIEECATNLNEKSDPYVNQVIDKFKSEWVHSLNDLNRLSDSD